MSGAVRSCNVKPFCEISLSEIPNTVSKLLKSDISFTIPQEIVFILNDMHEKWGVLYIYSIYLSTKCSQTLCIILYCKNFLDTSWQSISFIQWYDIFQRFWKPNFATSLLLFLMGSYKITTPGDIIKTARLLMLQVFCFWLLCIWFFLAASIR